MNIELTSTDTFTLSITTTEHFLLFVFVLTIPIMIWISGLLKFKPYENKYKNTNNYIVKYLIKIHNSIWNIVGFIGGMFFLGCVFKSIVIVLKKNIYIMEIKN